MAEAMLGAQIDMNYGKWLQAMWIIKSKEMKWHLLAGARWIIFHIVKSIWIVKSFLNGFKKYDLSNTRNIKYSKCKEYEI